MIGHITVLIRRNSGETETNDDFVKEVHIHDESEDEEQTERHHDKLLEAIGSLSSNKKIPSKQRNEPVSSASEFHASGNQDKLQLHELVGAIQSSSRNADLKKSLDKIDGKDNVLAVPLPRHEKEKIERTVAYDKTCEELKKWDPVVQKNRKADQIQFPLQQPDLKLINSRNSLKNFQPRTPLEREIATLLHGSDNVLQNDKVLTRAEERALKAMSLEEAKARRAELQKHRALLSYKEAKSKRTKKIKSKRYHRILRKEKLKHEKKTFEELEKTDPEAYLEKLQQLDRQRMQERMNLKHRGGSKYMKRQTIYAKYDDNARQSVQDMIQKNKELTQKIIQSDDEEIAMESNDDDRTVGMTTEEANNPWMSSGSGKRKSSVISRPMELVNKEAIILNAELEREKMDDLSDIANSDDESSGETKESGKLGETTERFRTIDDIFDKAETDQRKLKLIEQKVKRQITRERKVEAEAKRKERKEERRRELKRARNGKKEEDSESSESETDSETNEETALMGDKVHDGNAEGEDELMVSLQRKNKLEDFEGTAEVPKTLTYTPNLDAFGHKEVTTGKKTSTKGGQSKEVRLDPSKFFTVETSVTHGERSSLVEEGEGDEPEDQQRLTIAQAFASDDVVEEFHTEKQAVEERDKPKDIDLSLPGWGDWGGTGIQPSKKKRRRFIIKAPKAPPRKDRNLSNVIISETKDNSISKHQVSQLPFPFTNVSEFQNSIRQPIGRTWMPETSYKDIIQPKITTKLGTIIDPINKEETFKNSKKDDFNTKTNKGEPKKRPERTGKSDTKNKKRKNQK